MPARMALSRAGSADMAGSPPPRPPRLKNRTVHLHPITLREFIGTIDALFGLGPLTASRPGEQRKVLEQRGRLADLRALDFEQAQLGRHAAGR